MSRILGIALVLSLGIVGAALGEGGAAGQTVYLTVREPEAPGPAGGIAPMGMRELVRQAFLVAARDELGLSTRDVMLREDFPEKPDDKAMPFELFCRTVDPTDDRKIEFVLTRHGSPSRVLWQWTFTAENPQPIGPLANKAEALSRKEFKDVLVKAGFKGHMPAFRESSEVSRTTYDLLFTWNEISVLAALRRLHAEMHEKGESPELLGALAVGYANLGSLSEYYYNASRKVYYARAMLYGERLIYRTHESPWALWHAAYVAMQFGLHSLGADTITEAKRTQGSAPSAKPLPFFANVIDAFGEGDLKRMMKAAKTPAERRVALYFNWQAFLLGDLKEVKVEALRDFLRECPDCPRAYDALVSRNELGPSRFGAEGAFRVTARFLRKRLLDVPGLPEATAKRLKNSRIAPDVETEIELRKGVIADLKRAGAPEVDRGEPSLSAIAQTVEEIDFAQVIRRLEFNSLSLGVPVDDIIESMAPLCADHRYAAYLHAFSKNKQATQSAAAEVAKRVELASVTMKELVLLHWLESNSPSERLRTQMRIPGMHCDLTLIDQIRCIDSGFYGPADDPKTNAVSMRRFWTVCNKLPVAVAIRIVRDWERARSEVEKYERDYANDPLVLSALADRYYVLKRYDDAKRCAKRFVAIHPSYSSYKMLAAIYQATDDRVKWKETLDKAIELPPVGLEQAGLQNQIAEYLLERKEWKEAAIYADAAAESYSGWSMLTAAHCHEMLGEWKKSEAYIRAVSERYDNSMFEWCMWCHRTGKGDVQAADAFVHRTIETWGTDLNSEQYRFIGTYYLFVGEPEKALVLFQRAVEKEYQYYACMHAALAADSLGKTTERDAILQQIIKANVPPEAPGNFGANLYKPLAIQFQKTLASNGTKPLDLAAIEQLATVTKQYSPALLTYAVGVFLKNRGDLNHAKQYLIRCAHPGNRDKIDHSLACQLLREMKVKVPPVEDPPAKPEPGKVPGNSKPVGS